jgi:hypothetical protein
VFFISLGLRLWTLHLARSLLSAFSPSTFLKTHFLPLPSLISLYSPCASARQSQHLILGAMALIDRVRVRGVCVYVLTAALPGTMGLDAR